MSKDIKHIISNLRAASSQFNTNDVLVDAKSDHHRLYSCGDKRVFELKEFPNRILNEARMNMKEYGVNTLCIAYGIADLEIKGKEIRTPLLLIPLESSTSRVQQTITFNEIDDSAFVNPFLTFHLIEILNLPFTEDLISQCDFDTIAEFCRSEGLKIDGDYRSIGNFHHHRYQVLKELEELEACLEINPAIGSLLGEEHQELPPLNLSSSNLFPADTDHEAVFSAVSKSHTVIQGPPGTGKSQVICNLIGKALHAKQEVLVVSEKHAALEVIQSKLNEFGLDRLCFIAGSDRQSHVFLSSLKEQWDFMESYAPKTEVNLRLSEQYEANLQMTLDLLTQPDLIGGVSFDEFRNLSSEFGVDGGYSSKAPSISVFIEKRTQIEQIFNSRLHLQLPYLRKKTLESETFLRLDQQINRWVQQTMELQANFQLESWSDLSSAMKDAATCQIFENDMFKRYSSVFEPSSLDQKQFERLSKRYLGLSRVDPTGSEWKIYPSPVEAKSLHKQIQNTTFIERFKLKKRWKQLSNLPFSEAASLLKKRLEDAENDLKLKKCCEQLALLGIKDPTTEIEQIKQTMNLFSGANWIAFTSISADKRSKITQYHSELSRLHSELLASFSLEVDTPLLPFLEGIASDLPTLLTHRKIILELEPIHFESMKGCASFEEYGKLVFSSNHTVFKERFPAFSNFNPNDLGEKIDSIIHAQDQEARLEANELLNSVHQKFSDFHLLLNTPSTRLSTEQKTLKKELKKGKSLLVKEFSKTRSHPSLREFFSSEARHWITLLKPIWLSNPSSLAKCFPMTLGSFDIVIFDEASQLPIQHALGAIHRSKRVVVAGDENQMGPSTYFQSGTKEVTDLLHQSSYYFPKIPLLHHYRSLHPSLISFSNTHFYEGKLTAYPSFQSLDSVNNFGALRHHYIEGAQYIDRVNTREAIAIADHITSQLECAKSIGIVAFSEEQLSIIWKELGSHSQEKLLLHQEKHGGFFKALENVQGDECDCLIVGFGYAPNESGDFQLRFGPMNTVNGRKRLNVLLTRARESIDFFCSVRASEFKLSENESINLLRQWITFSETHILEDSILFPLGLAPNRAGNELEFKRIQEFLPSAREVATMHRVLTNRGWRVRYA